MLKAYEIIGIQAAGDLSSEKKEFTIKRYHWLENIVWFSFVALAAVVLLLTEVTTTWAQGAAGPKPQPGDVDPSLSRVIIHVGKTGLGHEHAVMGSLKSGKILLGAHQNAGSLVFDMTSFDADGPDARKYIGLNGESDANTRRQVNEGMHNASTLNTAKFPTATFQIDSALPMQKTPDNKNPPSYVLKGSLTLLGVSHPLELRCEVSPKENQQLVRTEFALKQTDYGIKPLRKALGTIGVADEMKVHGEIIIAPNPR